VQELRQIQKARKVSGFRLKLTRIFQLRRGIFFIQRLYSSLHVTWSACSCVRPSENKKIEVLCLSRKPSQCTLQVNGNTLKQVESFVLGVVFTGGGQGRLIRGLVKQTQFCVNFIALVTKRQLSNTAKLSVHNPGLFRSSPMVLNNDWKGTIPSTSSRDGILARSSRRGISRESEQL